MTTIVRAQVSPWAASVRSFGRVGAVLFGLAGIVGARWLATTRGADAMAVGAAFGLALAGLWYAATRSPHRGWTVSRRETLVALRRATRRAPIAALAGIGFGLALVGLTVLGAALGGASIVPGLARPAAPFLPWALITLVVATAEEGILRGVLFDRLRAAGGLPIAVSITTMVFALIHVPLYGWHVVPLDLAVGLGLAGLRLSTRTVLAPAIAHAVADLATWWL